MREATRFSIAVLFPPLSVATDWSSLLFKPRPVWEEEAPLVNSSLLAITVYPGSFPCVNSCRRWWKVAIGIRFFWNLELWWILDQEWVFSFSVFSEEGFDHKGSISVFSFQFSVFFFPSVSWRFCEKHLSHQSAVTNSWAEKETWDPEVVVQG